MKIRSFFILLLLLPLFTGCNAVLTQQPIGDEAVILDKATWEGTWLGGDIVVLTSVLDAENGVLQAAWVERGSEGARFESVTGTVRQSGELTFLNLQQEQFDDSTKPEAAAEDGAPASGANDGSAALPVEYVWARVDNDGQRILMWWPDTDEVRAAVSAGKFPGQLRGDDDVLLGPLTPEQLQAISAPGSAYLKWTEPVALTRITQ